MISLRAGKSGIGTAIWMDRGHRPLQGKQEWLCPRSLLNPGLLAEGDLPVAVVFFKQAGYVENFAMHGLVFGAHDRGVSEDPDFHRRDFGWN